MFRKVLVILIFLTTGSVNFAWNGPDTVCGWSGPFECGEDTGHIEISDSHIQGEHSLNFVIHYVNNPDTFGSVIFKRAFNGIEFPEKISVFMRIDTLLTSFVGFTLGTVYKDTVWRACGPSWGWYWPNIDDEWWEVFFGDPDFDPSMNWESGALIQPDTVLKHRPPSKIDTFEIQLVCYNVKQHDRVNIPSASLFLDSLKFWYIVSGDTIDTLVDSMGDKTGIEEIVSEKQTIKIYPNPCYSTIDITYYLPNSSHILFKVYDISGSKIVAFEEVKPAGKHRKTWALRDGKNQKLPAGIYFLQMVINGDSFTEKLLILQ
jgi:hypothetical protein